MNERKSLLFPPEATVTPKHTHTPTPAGQTHRLPNTATKSRSNSTHPTGGVRSALKLKEIAAIYLVCLRRVCCGLTCIQPFTAQAMKPTTFPPFPLGLSVPPTTHYTARSGRQYEQWAEGKAWWSCACSAEAHVIPCMRTPLPHSSPSCISRVKYFPSELFQWIAHGCTASSSTILLHRQKNKKKIDEH